MKTSFCALLVEVKTKKGFHVILQAKCVFFKQKESKDLLLVIS